MKHERTDLCSLQVAALAVTVALLSVTCTMKAADPDADPDSDQPKCLPDQECKGGLEVQYGGVEVKCGAALSEDDVVEAPAMEIGLVSPEDKNTLIPNSQVKHSVVRAGWLLVCCLSLVVDGCTVFFF